MIRFIQYKTLKNLCVGIILLLVTNVPFANPRHHTYHHTYQNTKESLFLSKLSKKTLQIQQHVFHNLVHQPISDPLTLKAIATIVDEYRFNKQAMRICRDISGCFVQFPPAGGKNLARAKQKAERTGGYQYVLDYSRLTVIVPYTSLFVTLDRIADIWDYQNIIWINDRITHHLSGYRDIQLYVKDSDSGLISEILILSPTMTSAKYGKGHQLYEKSRKIEAKAVSEKRNLTPTEKQIVKKYNEKMKQLYDTAHLAAVSSINN